MSSNRVCSSSSSSGGGGEEEEGYYIAYRKATSSKGKGEKCGTFLKNLVEVAIS